MAKAMPVYKKSGKRDAWRVVVWHRSRAQEWIVRGPKADAEAFEAKRRLELERLGPLEVRSAPSFYEFCTERYRPYAQTHLRPSTWSRRHYRLETLEETLGDLRLNRIGIAEVEAYKILRIRAGFKPNTINSELIVLQAVLAHARRLRFPCQELEISHLPAPGSGRVKAWTPVEVKRLYGACTPHILPMVTFLANTGCRKGEALALRWSDVDIKKAVVTIQPCSEWQPKNNLPREIPIGNRLVRLFRCLARQEPRGEFVFLNRWGQPFKSFPRKFWTQAVEAAGLSGGPHQLRHTFASTFLQNVPDMFLLAKVLGHSHTRVTAIYSHLLPDHLAKARGAVDL